jgi:hypothetical protein
MAEWRLYRGGKAEAQAHPCASPAARELNITLVAIEGLDHILQDLPREYGGTR